MTLFQVPIGDWSDDGHGKCTWFWAEANGTIEEIREAYFTANAHLPPTISPEKFMREYGDGVVPPKTRRGIVDLGGPDPKSEDDIQYWLFTYILWFINQGNESLKATPREDINGAPMLPFYGFDEKKRHIPHHGYGLFE